MNLLRERKSLISGQFFPFQTCETLRNLEIDFHINLNIFEKLPVLPKLEPELVSVLL